MVYEFQIFDKQYSTIFTLHVLSVQKVLSGSGREEGSALWGNPLATALLHDQNRTIPFGLIVLYRPTHAVFHLMLY